MKSADAILAKGLSPKNSLVTIAYSLALAPRMVWLPNVRILIFEFEFGVTNDDNDFVECGFGNVYLYQKRRRDFGS